MNINKLRLFVIGFVLLIIDLFVVRFGSTGWALGAIATLAALIGFFLIFIREPIENILDRLKERLEDLIGVNFLFPSAEKLFWGAVILLLLMIGIVSVYWRLHRHDLNDMDDFLFYEQPWYQRL